MIYGTRDLYRFYEDRIDNVNQVYNFLNDNFWTTVLSGFLDPKMDYADFAFEFQKESFTIGSVMEEALNTVSALSFMNSGEFYSGKLWLSYGEERSVSSNGKLPEEDSTPANRFQSANSRPRAVVTGQVISTLSALVKELSNLSRIELSTPVRTNNRLMDIHRFYGKYISDVIVPKCGYAFSPVEGLFDVSGYINIPGICSQVDGSYSLTDTANGAALLSCVSDGQSAIGRPSSKLISSIIITIGSASYDQKYYVFITFIPVPFDISTPAAIVPFSRLSDGPEMHASYLGMRSFVGSFSDANDICAKVSDSKLRACDMIRFLSFPEFPYHDGSSWINNSNVLVYTESHNELSAPYNSFSYPMSPSSGYSTEPSSFHNIFSSGGSIFRFILEKIIRYADWKVINIYPGISFSGKTYPAMLLATQVSGQGAKLENYLTTTEILNVPPLSFLLKNNPVTMKFLNGVTYQKVWHAYGPPAE